MAADIGGCEREQWAIHSCNKKWAQQYLLEAKRPVLAVRGAYNACTG